MAHHGHPHHPAAPATPVTPPPPQWHPLNWAFPFAPKSGNAADPQTWLHALAGADGGFYPLGLNGMFHGGIHFDSGTGSDLKQDEGVKVIADGEVVAYRLDSTYPELTYATTPPHYALYSSSFVLVRHKLVLPPAPDKSNPSATPATPGSGASAPVASGSSSPAPASSAAASAPATSAPAAPASGASAPGASSPQEYQPPADDVLEFYSLYMHQLDRAGYKTAENAGSNQSASSVHSLPFWQGDKHFRVGSKANDRQAQSPKLNTPFRFDQNSAGTGASMSGITQLESIGAGPSPGSLGAFMPQGDQTLRYALPPTGAGNSADSPEPAQGARICDKAKGTTIGLLPRGSELSVVGDAAKGWAQIASIISGGPVAAIAGGTPDPRATTGWVNLDELDAVIGPKPLDTVVVLDKPFPVKAGDVVGYLGEYTNSTQAQKLPPQPMRPLLHVEVFTGAQITAFITRSKDRASKLPDSGKTLLVIQAGAKIVNPADPQNSAQLAGTTLVLAKGTNSTKGDPGKGYWAKVQPTQFPAQSSTPGQGSGHNHHGHHNQPSQPVGTPVGNPLWVARKDAGKAYSTTVQAWTNFPLQLSNAQGTAVGYQQVLSRAQLDQFQDTDKATDDRGTQWWAITAGDSDGKTIDGWVCEKSHPNTEWQSPWSWPGFDTVDTTDTPLLDIYRRNLFVKQQLFDGEEKEFSIVAAKVNAGQFIARLETAAKQQGGGQGNVVPADLKNALTVRWLAEAVSHLIFRYESEWGGDMSKWEKFLPLMGDGKPTWTTEMERIKKLQWWDRMKAMKGFPCDPDVWHIHPIGLVGNFFRASNPNANSISENGIWFIFAHEAMAGVTNHLHWPGGASGVTLGAGYDMKARSAGNIITDMKSIGLSDATAQAISHGAGLQGTAANTFATANHNLVNLNDGQQVQLLRHIVTTYENMVRSSIKITISQNEFDALVSFAYNPAGRWQSVTNFINNGEVDRAMAKIREGNTSGGVVMPGLTNRRSDEVNLYQNNKYEFNGHPLPQR